MIKPIKIDTNAGDPASLRPFRGVSPRATGAAQNERIWQQKLARRASRRAKCAGVTTVTAIMAALAFAGHLGLLSKGLGARDGETRDTVTSSEGSEERSAERRDNSTNKSSTVANSTASRSVAAPAPPTSARPTVTDMREWVALGIPGSFALLLNHDLPTERFVQFDTRLAPCQALIIRCAKVNGICNWPGTFVVGAGSSLVVQNLSFTSISALGGVINVHGDASTHVRVENCVFTRFHRDPSGPIHTVGNSAAIVVQQGSATIIGCTFDENIADMIWSTEVYAIRVSDCTFKGTAALKLYQASYHSYDIAQAGFKSASGLIHPPPPTLLWDENGRRATLLGIYEYLGCPSKTQCISGRISRSDGCHTCA